MTERLHAVTDGPADAPVLVLGHSLGTTAAMWEPQLAALTRHFRVVRFDQRGHGESPVPPGPYTIAELADDVLALLDRLGLARVHYAGLSLGGMVGMELASRAPERVDRLALLCTSAHFESAASWHERADTVSAKGTAAVADTVVGRWFTTGFAEREPETVAAYAKVIAATPAQGYAGCARAIAGMDLRDRLGAITAPTMVVVGAEDPATPPDHGALIAELIPGARLVTVQDAAHMANLQQPEEINRLLVAHLTGSES